MSLPGKPRRRRPRTVLFDFDGTITRFDSSTHAVMKLIFGDPRRVVAALWALPLGLPLFMSRRAEAIGGSLFVWIATAGRARADYLREVRRIAELASTEDRVHQPVIQRLLEHVEIGDRVIVVTGSAENVARTMCAKLGIDVPVVGSKLRPFFGGYVNRIHCVGPRKVERLAQLHKLDAWDLVYTDSVRDLPMMQRARAVVLVNPSPRTLGIVSAALPATTTLEVLRA